MIRRSSMVGFLFLFVLSTLVVVQAAAEEVDGPVTKPAGDTADTNEAPEQTGHLILGVEARGTFFPAPGAGGELQLLWTTDDGQQMETFAIGLAAGFTRYFLAALYSGPSEATALNIDVLVLSGWPDMESRFLFRLAGRMGVMIFNELNAQLFTVHGSLGLQAGFMADEAGGVCFFVSPSVDWNMVYDDEIGGMALGYLSLNLGLTVNIRF